PWCSGLHVSGRWRPNRGKRISRDRAFVARRVLPVRYRFCTSAWRTAACGRGICRGRRSGAQGIVIQAFGWRAKIAVATEVAMPALIFGVLVLVLALWALNVISKVDPRIAARVTKIGGGVLSLGLAVFLGLRGEIGVAIPLGAFGLGLLGWLPF